METPLPGGELPSQSQQQQSPADSGMGRNVASFGSDLIQLMDLQTALLKADARDAVKKCVPPTVLFTIGLTLLLGMFPVLMAGLAALLVEQADWAWSTALLTVAGGSVALVVLLMLGGWLLFRSSAGAFTRSAYEWNRNKKWLTESLKQRF